MKHKRIFEGSLVHTQTYGFFPIDDIKTMISFSRGVDVIHLLIIFTC